MLRRDGVADVGAFEVVEGEDERVEVGEFGDALAVAVRVRQAHFLRHVGGAESQGEFRHSGCKGEEGRTSSRFKRAIVLVLVLVRVAPSRSEWVGASAGASR